MNGQRTVVRLSLLFVLVLSAFAASSASAAPKGTAAVTCVKKAAVGGAGFSKAHCKAADAVATGAAFEHVAIEGETKEIEGTNAGNGAGTETAVKTVLSGKIAGVATTIEAPIHHWTGNIITTFGPPHRETYQITGTIWTNVILPKGPMGCKLVGSEIKSAKLTATSISETMEFEVKPSEGTTLLTFSLEGCAVAELNGTYTVTGSFKAVDDGATLESTVASSEPTLKFAGQKASLTSVSTVKMKEGNPIGETTIE